jgi:hypothetical protein
VAPRILIGALVVLVIVAAVLGAKVRRLTRNIQSDIDAAAEGLSRAQKAVEQMEEGPRQTELAKAIEEHNRALGQLKGIRRKKDN